jgi:hypothetical protein
MQKGKKNEGGKNKEIRKGKIKKRPVALEPRSLYIA